EKAIESYFDALTILKKNSDFYKAKGYIKTLLDTGVLDIEEYDCYVYKLMKMREEKQIIFLLNGGN
ncbi:MAG: hypothetical protein RR090_12855, partial [Niameybacter sp.]